MPHALDELYPASPGDSTPASQLAVNLRRRAIRDREKHFAFDSTACEIPSVSIRFPCSLTSLERTLRKVQADDASALTLVSAMLDLARIIHEGSLRGAPEARGYKARDGSATKA